MSDLDINKDYLDDLFPNRKYIKGNQPVYMPYCHGLNILVEDFHFTDPEFLLDINIPHRWVWDGASIPPFAWIKFTKFSVGSPFMPQYAKASLIHDYLYECQPCDKKTADKVFHKILLSCGVHKWEARKMYFAVKIGGGRSYKKHSKRIQKNLKDLMRELED